MCGQLGIIFGEKRRSDKEMDYLKKVFAYLLLVSEKRGPHATGAAWLDREGRYDILKYPVKAVEFVRSAGFAEFLAGIGSDVTWLAGHTRWKTRGDAANNRNNHPIRAGQVIGTHNGTIANADELFARSGLPRYAEVDSEIIFRVADATLSGGAVDVGSLAECFPSFEGQMSAVMASVSDPERVVVVKGNRPLSLRYSRWHRAILYASDPAFLNLVLAGAAGWRSVDVPPMSVATFTRGDLANPDCRPFKLAGSMRSGRDLADTEGLL